MNVNELFNIKNNFTNLGEWKKTVIEKYNGIIKIDPYDENVYNATNSRGHIIGYFNISESYGEIVK
jgi:hypothetical protein